jgi:hypothetical protein
VGREILPTKSPAQLKICASEPSRRPERSPFRAATKKVFNFSKNLTRKRRLKFLENFLDRGAKATDSVEARSKFPLTVA